MCGRRPHHSFRATLDAHDSQMARRHLRERGQNLRGEGRQNWQTRARRANDDDADPPAPEILLIPQPLVGGNERIVLRLGGVEQRAVIEIRPAALVHTLNPVRW